MIFRDMNIRELMELMERYGMEEVTLKDGKVEVELKRSGTVAPGEAITAAPEAQGVPEPQIAVPSTEPGAASPAEQDHHHTVRAPLVGTFYRAPAPDAEPFVEVGDVVKKGDVLCIVEAMKSMNEIESDTGGIVREICTENAGLVEFGQVLFKIDTGG